MSLEQVFKRVKQEILQDFEVVGQDLKRPWGGFFKVNETQCNEFINQFFPGLGPSNLSKISPKILVFAPNSRLSWQVHQRRTEAWKVIEGPVGIYLSETDTQPESPQIYQQSEQIMIPVGTRHRNAKVGNFGIVAEIWVHTDPGNLSDEDDIRRISDDYGR